MRMPFKKMFAWCLAGAALTAVASCSKQEQDAPAPPSAHTGVQASQVSWSMVSGGAVEIVSGKNGGAWVLGTGLEGPNGYQVYRSVAPANTTWAYVPSPGGIRLIKPVEAFYGGTADEPWLIGKDGIAYRYTGSSWKPFSASPGAVAPPFPIVDMAFTADPTNPNTLIYVLRDDNVPGGHSLYKRANNVWVNMNKGLTKIAFENLEVLLGIDANTLIWSGSVASSTWTQDAGLAVDIAENHNPNAVSSSLATDAVVGVSQSDSGGGNQIFTATAPLTTSWLWTLQPGGAVRIAVGEDSGFWLVASDNTIWKGY